MEITPSRPGGAWRAAGALVAVALPALIAFNLAPSATFFNQAVAFVGWGGFLLLLSAAVPRSIWPRSAGSRALLGALALLVVAAIASSLMTGAPWSLTLSAAGTVIGAAVVVSVAACAMRVGLGEPVFRALCLALVVAGVLSSVIGIIQVFAPNLADGNWIAPPAVEGRATSNLRQPNHLSSLLLWSVVAMVWLAHARPISRHAAALVVPVFLFVIVLSGSRTGALGMLTLALWGVFDRRLRPRWRAVLVLTPLLYGLLWAGMSAWADYSHQTFGAQTRFSTEGDISASRFAIWSNALALIAAYPWLGVGFGEFNFAWTLTPFPDRPVAFFDHTHNLPLNFAAELGIPAALVVLGLMTFALWRALRNAVADGREAPAEPAGVDSTPPPRHDRSVGFPVQRGAFVMVVLVTVHSLLEYPLWYAYFLLPAAFMFGLCLERPVAGEARLAAAPEPNVTRPFVLASMLLIMGGTLALYDYLRVVVIFVPPANAAPLAQRIAEGRRSVLFAHHGDYAAATMAEPGKAMDAFRRAPHFLLDTRLMMAWALALNEIGEVDKARHLAARLKEFRNPQAEEFFAPCAAPAAASASAAAALPFQCLAPRRPVRFEEFR